MKTDKELYKIFSAYPNYLFKCASIRKKTTYTMQSVTFKEFERRTDGVLTPKDPKAPTYIAEFQAQTDVNIYHRLAMEMASYAMKNKNCDVRGILVFLHKGLDPKSNPWHYLSKSREKFLKIVYLDEFLKELEQRHPNHPMVAAFKPLFEKDLNELKKNAYHLYQKIKKSRLPKDAKESIQNAFISWLTMRFKDLPYQEVIKMIASLPNFEQTRFFQDIVGIGEKRGETRGEKRGEKHGEKKWIVKEINRFEKMRKKGDINDSLFKKLCDPLYKELDKVTEEIDKLMSKSHK
ncbi:hypothetical protein MHK_010359 [Candidatus Magnetomorum sp. HK-1]|nr:hypothetical protein MHK_010359 [Candidatus Magnetomorum sp. HK-1]